ncbi:hypothetical protein [Tenacibaculum xiamenense]|uniref:hypothetical protein n=1 Tax=Tenacibaculum xiamenense TaxID=1261553 RepID=UPI003894EE73
MKNIIITLITGLIVVSCNPKKKNGYFDNQSVESALELNDKMFELPITFDKAKDIFNIDEFGRKGDIDNRKYLVHHKDGKNIIGITYYVRNYKENPDKSVKIVTDPRKKYIAEFEKKNNMKFKKLDIENTAFVNPNFVYIKLKDNSVIVIGTMLYNLMYNSYTTISYFKEVEKGEIKTYLGQLY